MRHHTKKNMYCEKCGALVGENEKSCPSCGAPTSTDNNAVQNETPVQPAEQTDKKEKSRRKSKLPFIAVMVAVVLVLVLGFANRAALANTVMKMVSSPEEYYRWVEEQELKNITKVISNVYSNYILNSKSSYDQSSDVKVSVKFEEGMEEWLEMLDSTGVDLTWFTDGALTWNHNLKDNVAEEKLSLAIGGEDLLEVRAVADFVEELFYIGIPTLSDSYIYVNMSDYIAEEEIEAVLASSNMMKNLGKALPTAAKVNKLLDKYLTMVLELFEEVEIEENKKLRAGDVTQECTRLEVIFDEELLYEVAETVMKALEEDEEVKEIIYSVCEVLEETEYFEFDADADEIYERFTDMCAELANDASEGRKYAGDEEVVMYVYVDGAGKVVGRELVLDGSSVTLKLPRDGKEFGFEFSSSDGENTVFCLEGSGTESGSKFTGEFELEAEKAKVVEFQLKDFDVDELKKGYFNGTVSMGIPDGLKSLVDTYFENAYSFEYDYYGYDYTESMDYQAIMAFVSALKDIELSLSSEMSGSKSKVVLAVNEEEEKLCSITVASETADGRKVSSPSENKSIEFEDEGDFADWWDTLKWDAFIDKLDEVDIPSDFVDLIEMISETDLEDPVY